MHRKLTTSELNRLSAEEFRERQKFPIIIVLDNVRSGLNVGSIFRSADAFNIEKIICCGITPTPPNREVLKSALGSTETVDWEYATTALEAVQKLINSNVLLLLNDKERLDRLSSNKNKKAVKGSRVKQSSGIEERMSEENSFDFNEDGSDSEDRIFKNAVKIDL